MPRSATTPKTHVMPGETHPAHFLAMYDYLAEYVREHGYPPTNREMVGMDETNSETYRQGYASSTSVLRYYYAKMEELGMIAVTPRIARGVRIIPRAQWQKHATAKMHAAKSVHDVRSA